MAFSCTAGWLPEDEKGNQGAIANPPCISEALRWGRGWRRVFLRAAFLTNTVPGVILHRSYPVPWTRPQGWKTGLTFTNNMIIIPVVSQLEFVLAFLQGQGYKRGWSHSTVIAPITSPPPLKSLLTSCQILQKQLLTFNTFHGLAPSALRPHCFPAQDLSSSSSITFRHPKDSCLLRMQSYMDLARS